MSLQLENFNVTQEERELTVEEFLRKRCQEEIERIHTHSEQLVEKFLKESQKKIKPNEGCVIQKLLSYVIISRKIQENSSLEYPILRIWKFFPIRSLILAG
ncbi:hypothetical protein M0812_20748 [Anaeramoeba flamelloides]|uniref:Uncharacterized protein n=1 Tax=Anaeramoeba flamelloides TaxID=1746091 RepID=A0AAV7YSM4_9EUKA|nr:hypothetical protein M0812_20748 [Anaeramoeba flamelloides]